MNVVLDKCPFCGGCSQLKTEHSCFDLQFSDDIDRAYCICTNCGASGGVESVKNARYRDTCEFELKEMYTKAIEKWNKRI